MPEPGPHAGNLIPERGIFPMTKRQALRPSAEPCDPILELTHARAQAKAKLDAANSRAAPLDDDDAEYGAAANDVEQFRTAYLDIEAAICRTPAVSIEGAMAKLEVACTIIRDARLSGEFGIDEMGVLGAFDDLKRLLREGA
jgi:hypothetical protein